MKKTVLFLCLSLSVMMSSCGGLEVNQDPTTTGTSPVVIVNPPMPETIQPVHNVSKQFVLPGFENVEVSWEYSGEDESIVDHYKLTYSFVVNFQGGGFQGPFTVTQTETSRVFFAPGIYSNYNLTIVAVDADGNESTPVDFQIQ